MQLVYFRAFQREAIKSEWSASWSISVINARNYTSGINAPDISDVRTKHPAELISSYLDVNFLPRAQYSTARELMRNSSASVCALFVFFFLCLGYITRTCILEAQSSANPFLAFHDRLHRARNSPRMKYPPLLDILKQPPFAFAAGRFCPV